MMNMNTTFNPDYCESPGDMLADVLEFENLTQEQLAMRVGVPAKRISEIIHAKAKITPELALSFECVLKVPSSSWLNAESIWQEYLARKEMLARQEEERSFVKNFPIAEMLRLKMLPCLNKSLVGVNDLCKFFAIGSSLQWDKTYRFRTQGMARSSQHTQNEYALSVWIRTGEILAQGLNVDVYSKDKFAGAMNEIRGLTRRPIKEAWAQAVDLCSQAGVAVVLVPELKGTHISGFTKWMNDLPVIMLSLRGKTDDKLWFTFFHEAAHILLHGKKECFFEYGNNEEDSKEKEANIWAAQMLLPAKQWDEVDSFFSSHPKLSMPLAEEKIQQYASRYGVADSIILGRLQKNKRIPYTYGHRLQQKVDITWKGIPPRF